MTANKYNIFTLPNGMRCIHHRTDSLVAYIGIAVNVGSRDENPDKDGLAHFVEHTIFKGTKNRSSWHISNRMETVGGELNAYTSKEETVIYTNAPAGYAERTIQLLADLVAYSNFPSHELENERDVVIEEIYSYRDSPGDLVYDEFDDLIYAGSRLGHNILGTEESVRKIQSADCRAFLDEFYVPSNIVLYCVCPDSEKAIERLALKYFGALHHPAHRPERHIPHVNKPFSTVKNQDGHQAHTIVGVRTFGRDDDRRFPLFILNNYLGGPCMNSRLNLELRERRGYVYTVDSSVALLSDAGTLLIYFGSDKSTVDKCLRIIHKELDRLTQSPLSPTVFERIKRQYASQLLVSSDQRESVAMSLGKSLLYYNEVHDISWTSERILDVSAEQLREVAEMLVSPSRLTIL